MTCQADKSKQPDPEPASAGAAAGRGKEALRFDRVVAVGMCTAAAPSKRARILELAALLPGPEHQVVRFVAAAGPATLPMEGVDADAAPAAPPVGSPATAAAGRAFLESLPHDAVWVVHGGERLRTCLRRDWGVALRQPVVDTLKLSGICFPESPSHRLQFLCERLGVATSSPAPAATELAQWTARLWEALLAKTAAYPEAVRHAVFRVLRGLRHEPIRELFRSERRAATKGQPLVDAFPEKPFPRRRAERDSNDASALDPEAVSALFAPGGALEQSVSHYEYRAEQERMTHAVVEALNRGQHVVAEAGTGTGKSLAYLVPAVLWSVINRTPVVVSTNTKNLQTQLYCHDLPLAAEVSRAEPRTALVKGRRNYLCLRRLCYLLEHLDTEVEGADRLPLASVVCWASETVSGDISESLVGDRPHLAELASRVTSVAEECGGPACAMLHRCFLQRMRRSSLAADVVVTNHAVVFAELASPIASPALPPYDHLVMDEAHNLEDAATAAMTIEVSQRRIVATLNRLVRPAGRTRRRGLLPSILSRVGGDGAAQDESHSGRIAALAVLSIASVLRARDCVAPLFRCLRRVLGEAESAPTRRLQPGGPGVGDAPGVAEALAQVLAALAAVQADVTGLVEAVQEAQDQPDLPLAAEFCLELRAAALWVGEFAADAQRVLRAEDPAYVYWIEGLDSEPETARAWGAPIAVGPLLHERLYAPKRSVLLTSATLTVRGSPAFLKSRLGMDMVAPERVQTVVLGTPFDHARQSLVLVPVFLPEPGRNDPPYAIELGRLLARMVRCTQGRTMVLFTSYDMLGCCLGVMQRELVGTGIRILAQGTSGSRDSITRLFREEGRSVLLGTHSFWEGVDIVGEALSCLVLARLPFPVFTDPLIAARGEAIEADGGDAFRDYSLPSAAIRFRQGFGRLIRHRSDRGVVVVADRRIVSRRYGEWFRDCIPAAIQCCAGTDQLLAAVRSFLCPAQTPQPAP